MNGWRWVVLATLVMIAAGCSGARDEESSSVSPPQDNRTDEAASSTGEAPGSLPDDGASEPATAGAEPPFDEPDAAFSAAPMMADGPPESGEESAEPEQDPNESKPTDDHVIQVFYATDREPSNVTADSAVTWRHYLPTGLAAFVMVLSGLAAVFLPRKAVTVPIALLALIGTVVLGQMAVVRAQQLHRAAYYGDRSYGSGRHEIEGRPLLELGVCEVSIPPDHRVGQVESPSILRLEFRENPEKHVILERVVRLPSDEFHETLGDTIAESTAKQAFVFVHGYNVGFDAAVKRTAQIAHDLEFDGAAICYSWPSHAGLARYTQDESNVAWTVTQLESFLRDVSKRTGARTLHLVAHSMGNRAMTQAVERLALRGDGPRFGQVILAAPDIDTSEFRTRYVPALRQVADRVTLYASSNDRALLASTRVHGYTRAGLSGEHLLVMPGLETIDVSPIDTSLIGHSYYGDNPMMIRDLVAVIHLGLPADGREWLRRNLVSPDAFYWAFRPDETAVRP